MGLPEKQQKTSEDQTKQSHRHTSTHNKGIRQRAKWKMRISAGRQVQVPAMLRGLVCNRLETPLQIQASLGQVFHVQIYAVNQLGPTLEVEVFGVCGLFVFIYGFCSCGWKFSMLILLISLTLSKCSSSEIIVKIAWSRAQAMWMASLGSSLYFSARL